MIPSGLKTLSAAVACAALFMSGAQAAALGKLTVLSALGQPLRAEIEINAVGADETANLAARLASSDAYRQANIDFNPALSALRFAVQQRGGRWIVAVSSTQPVNEPFVDMLLELSSGSGRLVREYTFLLDPAEMRATQPAQVVAAAEAPSAPAQTPKAAAPAPEAQKPEAQKPETQKPEAQKPAPVAGAPAPRAGKAARPAGPMAGSGEYKVKAGDSLGFVANQVRPNEVSLDQMLVALFRANPDAFIGNNMNRLRSGQILKVPDEANVRSVSEAEAKGIVIAQAGDFNSYRNKLAGQVQQTAPEQAPAARQSGAGRITAKVEEKPTAANSAEDKLKLSRTMDGKPGADDAGKAAPAGVEDKVAQAKAASEAGERVQELERNVNELERLMALKNRALAGQPAAPATAATSTTTAAAAAPAKPKRSTAEPAGPGLAEALAADPKLPLLGGVLVALLAGLGGLSAYRRRKAAAHDDAAVIEVPVVPSESAFVTAGGQSVDTNNSVFNSSFAPSASQLDTNEVDPVAEADVYIAYGRDVQAEEILKEALRNQPDRAAARLKLLEIYANRKDTRQFEGQARELFSLTAGEGDDWAQAAALGLTIDPDNPLYASAAAQRAPVLEEALPAGAMAADARVEQALQEIDLDLTQAQPALAAAMDADLDAAPAPAPARDDNVLDFDLGGLSFDSPPSAPAAAPVSAPPAPAASAPDAAMDFGDFDIEPIDAAPAPEPVPAPEPASAAASAPLAPDLSFDLDLPGETPAAPAPAAAPAADDEFDIGDIDFDLPPAPAPAAGTPAPAAAELPDLDLDGFDLPAATPAPPPLDLPDLDLDLPGAAPASGMAELTPLQVEMDTKLDLAMAYQEIGDKEGARELIEEVLAGGSPEQIAKAESMRAKLG